MAIQDEQQDNSSEHTDQPTIVDLTDEPAEEIQNPLRKDSVSEKDIFELAKRILFTCLCLYVLIVILFAWAVPLCIDNHMKEIWDFSSQGLFGIVNLIIGFYFGGKIAAKS